MTSIAQNIIGTGRWDTNSASSLFGENRPRMLEMGFLTTLQSWYIWS